MKDHSDLYRISQKQNRMKGNSFHFSNIVCNCVFL